MLQRIKVTAIVLGVMFMARHLNGGRDINTSLGELIQLSNGFSDRVTANQVNSVSGFGDATLVVAASQFIQSNIIIIALLAVAGYYLIGKFAPSLLGGAGEGDDGEEEPRQVRQPQPMQQPQQMQRPQQQQQVRR